jgi:hypothetical protein
MVQSMLAIRNPARAAQWCARFELQEGRAMRALDRCLDAAWFGADLMRAGQKFQTDMGLVNLRESLVGAAEAMVAEPSLVAARMLPALQRLGGSFPALDGALMDRAIWSTRRVLQGEDTSSFGRRMRFELRRPVYIQDIPQMLDDLQWQRTVATAPWPDVTPALDAIRARKNLSSWLGIRKFWRPEKHLIGNHRRVLAMVRLLLMACSEGRVTGEDPFGDRGTPLRSRREAGRLVLWSVGRDGVDDGGDVPDGLTGFVFRFDRKSLPDLILVLPLPPHSSPGGGSADQASPAPRPRKSL